MTITHKNTITSKINMATSFSLSSDVTWSGTWVAVTPRLQSFTHSTRLYVRAAIVKFRSSLASNYRPRGESLIQPFLSPIWTHIAIEGRAKIIGVIRTWEIITIRCDRFGQLRPEQVTDTNNFHEGSFENVDCQTKRTSFSQLDAVCALLEAISWSNEAKTASNLTEMGF